MIHEGLLSPVPDGGLFGLLPFAYFYDYPPLNNTFAD